MTPKVVPHEQLMEVAEYRPGKSYATLNARFNHPKRRILDVIGKPVDHRLQMEGWNSYTCIDQDEARGLLSRFVDKSDSGRAGSKRTQP